MKETLKQWRASFALRAITALVAAGALLVLTGCEAYQLRGKAVAGMASTVEVVNADDPRLEGPGLSGVRIEGWIDPDRLDREALPVRATSGDGTFAIPVTSTGAGFLEYDVYVSASRMQRAAVAETLRLPGSNKRLLITLAPGDGDRRQRYGDPLGDTLRDASPYLR
ncbi:MAG: hypothetical protein AAF078_10625 [Planctomycetota bacterium]